MAREARRVRARLRISRSDVGRYIPAEVRPQLDAEYAEYEARLYGVYDTQGAESRPGVLLFLGGLLLWSVLIVVRELMPFGSKASNPLLVSAGFRRYRLHWDTGTVTGYESWTETVETNQCFLPWDLPTVRGSTFHPD